MLAIGLIEGLSREEQFGHKAAILLGHLCEQDQKRDRLRLIVDYRKKYLDSLVRGGEEEAKQVETHCELCQLSEQKPGVLDELAAERARLLDKESAELEKQASQLAEEIKELSGQSVDRIV